MWSSRLPWTRSENALSRLRRLRKEQNSAVLDLTESNPVAAGFLHPEGSVLEALGDSRCLQYEPDPRGLREAREAISQYYADAGESIAPERIVLTASTSEAYSYLFKVLCDSGDAVLTPRPSYPLFEFLAGLEGVATQSYPLIYQGKWQVDLEALESAITPRTRAIAVVHPNNPTGSYTDLGEWAALVALAGGRGLALLSDEVFRDYGFQGRVQGVAGLYPGSAAPMFILSGLSKVCALPQMKLGWIAVAGETAVAEAALSRLELVADTFLSVSAPVQYGLTRLLSLRSPMQARIRERCLSNLRLLREHVVRMSGCDVLHAGGGWCATIRTPRLIPEEDLVLLLLERDSVLLQPGYFYDFPSECYLVLSLLTDPGVFREGVQRLEARWRIICEAC